MTRSTVTTLGGGDALDPMKEPFLLFELNKSIIVFVRAVRAARPNVFFFFSLYAITFINRLIRGSGGSAGHVLQCDRQ